VRREALGRKFLPEVRRGGEDDNQEASEFQGIFSWIAECGEVGET
jgi:hypothetical protein